MHMSAGVARALRRKYNSPILCLSGEQRGSVALTPHYMEFVWFILIGLAAGWLAGQLMKGGGFGVVGDIVVGVIGALLGGFLFHTLGVSAGGGLLGSLIVAVIGAVVLLFLLRLIKKA